MEFERYQRSGLDGKVAWRGEGLARPVDACGRFPRGETFSAYLEFKEQFARHYQEDLLRGLLKKLTLYGTGRIPNVLDLKAIDEIMPEGRKRDYRLQDLLVALLDFRGRGRHSLAQCPGRRYSVLGR